MLDLDSVRYNIERWIETFVEVPNPALGGWSPCPYARQARLNNEYPADPEIVNGISMNQGNYALALVQGLGDLNEKAQLVARKGFYDTWPEEYLTVLFQHREDPRV